VSLPQGEDRFPQAAAGRRFPQPKALPARRRRRLLRAAAALCAALLAALFAACQRGGTAVALRAPADNEIPAGALGASIRRGRALLEHTRDSLPANVGNKLRCLSCHLDGGMRANSAPLVGVYARFPQYSARSGTTITIQDRINGCFVRSMNGHPLPAASPALRDITAYLAFLSREVPVGAHVMGEGFAAMTPLKGDSAIGRMLFASRCARCHGDDGGGTVVAPPLWGTESFNIGAGMARLRTAASFIRHNMPYDQPGTLTDQQAFDVAAYVTSRPRPDLPGKEYDWPRGGAPPDVAYPTLGTPPQEAARAQSKN
jgi:thiosulfate dehydrogenase